MRIIDAHIHLFSQIQGANQNGSVIGRGYGKILNAGVESPFLPPLCPKTCFTREMVMETLAQNGIEKAVLMQNPTIGETNAEVGQAVESHPELFAGAAQVDCLAQNAAELAEEWLRRYPLTALKLELSTGWGWTGIHRAKDFTYAALAELLEVARKHRLTVVVDTGDTDSYAYQPESLQGLIQAFSSIPFVIEHGGYMTPGGDVDKWRAMVALGRMENVYLGISAMGSLMEDPYPCMRAEALLKEIVRVTGGERLIWGTDAPCTLKRYTYQQILDAVLNSNAFSSRQKDATLFENAMHLYF